MTNAQIAKWIADDLCGDLDHCGEYSKDQLEQKVSTILHEVLVAAPRFRANDGRWQEW